MYSKSVCQNPSLGAEICCVNFLRVFWYSRNVYWVENILQGKVSMTEKTWTITASVEGSCLQTCCFYSKMKDLAGFCQWQKYKLDGWFRALNSKVRQLINHNLNWIVNRSDLFHSFSGHLGTALQRLEVHEAEKPFKLINSQRWLFTY